MVRKDLERKRKNRPTEPQRETLPRGSCIPSRAARIAAIRREATREVEEFEGGRKIQTYQFGSKTYHFGELVYNLMTDRLDEEEDKDCLEALIGKGEAAGNNPERPPQGIRGSGHVHIPSRALYPYHHGPFRVHPHHL